MTYPQLKYDGQIKAGWKTTEFWVVVLPIVGIFALVMAGKMTVDQAINLWPVIVGSGSYAVARGLAKL